MTHFGPLASVVVSLGSVSLEYSLCFWWTNWHIHSDRLFSEYCDFCCQYNVTNSLRSYFI